MDIRPSPIAGRWYPGAAADLTQNIDQYLAAVPAAKIPGEIVGVIAPHAGHIYSGPVAAYAYQAVRGLAVDSVVIVSPSHFHADSPLLTSAHAAYATPLGEVPLDRDTLEAVRTAVSAELEQPAEIIWSALHRDREHAIEIQLPFLQRVLPPGFKLIPVMMRDQSETMARALGRALAQALAGRRALLIGSSDLSHFYSQAEAAKLDQVVLQRLQAFDPAGILAAESAGQGLACGHGAIAATLWAAQQRGATRATVLKYATSGDITGDLAEVVGYGAAVLVKD